MQFLLECIGFPPDTNLPQLAQVVAERGEPVAWRGPTGLHVRVPFRGGLEVRLDQEEGQEFATLWPYFDVQHRLRVSVQSIDALPDSPYDVVLSGIANPPPPARGPEPEGPPEDYALSTYLADARRLPLDLEFGHVLAVSVAGFGIDLSYVGPNEGARDPFVLEESNGASLLPLGTADTELPRGCMQVSLRVRSVRRLRNPLTQREVEVIEVDAPGRPLELFLSPWQLAEEGLPAPRPGSRIEGTFLFTGRVSGGLPARRIARRR